MKGNCERCALPEIVQQIDGSKAAAEVANANIRSSTSPTEAAPYRLAAEEAVKKLQAANKELRDFLDMWAGTCDECEYEG